MTLQKCRGIYNYHLLNAPSPGWGKSQTLREKSDPKTGNQEKEEGNMKRGKGDRMRGVEGWKDRGRKYNTSTGLGEK